MEITTSYPELLGNFPCRRLPPLYLRKSAGFWGQCSFCSIRSNEFDEKIFFPIWTNLGFVKFRSTVALFLLVKDCSWIKKDDSPTEPRTTEPRIGLLSEWTQPQMGMNPEWTQPRNGSTPKGLNPEWTQPRRDRTPNGLNPEWTELRMDRTQNGTQHRMDLTPNGTQHRMDWT